jgi:hypothetical protein
MCNSMFLRPGYFLKAGPNSLLACWAFQMFGEYRRRTKREIIRNEQIGEYKDKHLERQVNK